MAASSNQERAPMVGVLALQGDFEDHQASLAASGLRTRQVRTAGQLQGLDGLVLPGGESTTMLKLLEVEGLWEPLGQTLRSGIPVMATCAGMILLSLNVENPQQKSYGLLPLTVVRNGYGRQLHSGTFPLESKVLPQGTTGTFIRAPRVAAVHAGASTGGDACEVLAYRGEDPVLVRHNHLLAACFHPELTIGHPVTRLFAKMVRDHVADGAESAYTAAL